MAMIRNSSYLIPRSLLLLSALLGTASLGACSSDDDAGAQEQDIGELGLRVHIGDDVNLETISYEIVGPGFLKTGTIDVAHSTTIQATIGGIPGGAGYVVTLRAVDAPSGQTTCVGSASFDIVAGHTTVANVSMQCTLPDGDGSVLIDGTVNVCPRIDGVSASPSEVVVGQSLALLVEMTDVDFKPAIAVAAWTTSSGWLAQPDSVAPQFTCTQAGNAIISVVVDDGDCSDEAQIEVMCTEPAVVDPAAMIRINEVESSGGVPGDWVELYNAEETAVDLSGWVVKDNDDGHSYIFPSGTVIAAHGYLVVEDSALGYGLGSSDSARLYRPDGTTLVDATSWVGHAITTYGRCPNATGPFVTMTTVTKGGENDCSVPTPDVIFNEIESSGGTPGDWVELYNRGVFASDLSGWTFKDSDDGHAYVLPEGSVIAAGDYLVLDEADFGFGLGSADSARIFAPGETTPAASYSWTAHAATSYGRCPDVSGEFGLTKITTKGALNICPGDALTLAWPGADSVSTVDLANTFGANMSGLTYQPAVTGEPAVLWGAQNSPSKIHRLLRDGNGKWLQDTANGWAAGKLLHYPDGLGAPDTEGLAKAHWNDEIVYTVAERDNLASGVSRLSILRFDVSGAQTELTATHEWNVTAALPVVGANLGLEAITWVPDAFLVANGFYDQQTAAVYDPASYPNHGDGLFFVGVEGTGMLHVFALNHADSSFVRVASMASGHVAVMGLEFDRDSGSLIASCDNTCGNKLAVLELDTIVGSASQGAFVVDRLLSRPSSLPDSNNEGIAFAPASECVAGVRSFFWSDDDQASGFALREDALQCAAF